jgi:uncharacterized membrane protein YcjF (UPF0283 family)
METMIGLGIFILVIVGLASLAVVFQGGDPVRINLHLFTVKTSIGIVFLAGAVALALVVFAVSLLWEGLKRGRRRRRETKDLRRRAEANQASAPLGATSGSTATSAAAPRTAPSAPPTPGPAPRTGPDDHFDTAPREP